MIRRDGRWARAAVAVAALATIGAALAQDQGEPARARPAAKDGKAAARKVRGGLRLRGAAPPKKVEPGAADPLARAAGNKPAPPRWPYHYRFKLVGADGVALTARFYPARASTAGTAALLLVHQTGAGHSGQDFEEPVEALQGRTIAERLQALDYAVLIVDRRGHGGTPARRQVVGRDPATLVEDLQSAYTFLIDRHNRRELNLARFGVLAVGDGANLAALWAASPGGAISSPGRMSDLGGLVLVSPATEAFGVRLTAILSPLAPHLPIFFIAGSRDADAYHAARPLVERNRASKGVLFDTRLQGKRLLEFEPKVIDMVTKFLDDPVKFRPNTAEWEPRYLLAPIAYEDIETIPGKPDETAAKEADAKKAAEPQVQKKQEAAKKEPGR